MFGPNVLAFLELKQLKATLATVLSVSLASQVSAMCEDYSADGLTEMPVIRICYEEKCDYARQIFFCSAKDSAFTEFDIGWRFEHSSIDGQSTVYWQGRKIDPDHHDKISCREVEGWESVESVCPQGYNERDSALR